MSENSNVMIGTIARPWDGLDGKPKSITFSVTEDCNLACKYCYMTGKNHLKKMTFETAKKAVDYILRDPENLKYKSVVWDFIGGEPFLEMPLIDKITDYIKQQMFLLDHHWFNSYRMNFSSNGILYHTTAVQDYIKKNKKHLSIGLSVDGNKKKHDLQRIHPDGRGSYDEVVRNVPLWLEQFPNAATKATFAHDDLPYLKESIISLWDLGIKNVFANVVFEDVWQEGDDDILEEQLRSLADYIIENQLWDKSSVAFFQPHIGKPLPKENLRTNYCGAGEMLAVDCEGNFAPCVRFLNVSLNNKKPRFIGNAETGVDQNKLRGFRALDVKSQSLPECLDCEVATGCAWCQGCNYDLADTDTIYQRATFICKMHKATVRANKYFWQRFEEATGKLSLRKHIVDGYWQEERYLQFITSDQITPHCAYSTSKEGQSVMSEAVFEEGLKFCSANDWAPVLLGKPQNIDPKRYEHCMIIDEAGKADTTIAIYEEASEVSDDNTGVGIYLLNKKGLDHLSEKLQTLFAKLQRINLVIQDEEIWQKEDVAKYREQLDKIVDYLAYKYQSDDYVELNRLNDLWGIKEMSNCDAGENTFTLAPNGKFYICPAFYFEDPENDIGSLEEGLKIKNRQLLKNENAPICSVCDVYSCDRCKYLNKKLTDEINIPSHIQCLISHVEREASRKLQSTLSEEALKEMGSRLIDPVEYSDPLDKILVMKGRK